MRKRRAIVFVTLIIFTVGIHTANSQVNEQDSLALIALYNSTNGENRTDPWNLTQPVSAWNGISVTDGRVLFIDWGNASLFENYGLMGPPMG